MSTGIVLLTGLAGLLAGALSMGAGEYVSVRSQRELLEASTPDPQASAALPHLDVDANELALRLPGARDGRGRSAVARRRGPGRAGSRIDVAAAAGPQAIGDPSEEPVDEHEAVGTGLGAAVSSFCFFASGAVIPVLPYLFGLEGLTAVDRGRRCWSGWRCWPPGRRSACSPGRRR